MEYGFESEGYIESKCFDRVIIVYDGKVLLFERDDPGVSSGIDMVGKFEIPGGGYEDYDIDHKSTAVREVFEETRIILFQDQLKYFLTTKSIYRCTEYINHFWVVELYSLPLNIPNHLLIDKDEINSLDSDRLILDHFNIISIFINQFF